MKQLYLLVCLAAFFSFSSQAQLSGSYTINPNGTGPNNYTTFQLAINALNSQGVNGAVTFTLAPVLYLQSMTIDSIAGASATNTVTFQPDPLASGMAGLQSSPICNGAVLWIMGDWITVRGLALINQSGSSCSGGVGIGGNSEGVVLQNCLIDIQGSVSASLGSSALRVDAGAKNLKLIDNTFEGGGNGLSFNGTSASRITDVIVDGNDFVNNIHQGISMDYTNHATIHNNVIRSTVALDDAARGIDLFDCDFANVTYNSVGTDFGNGYDEALSLENCDGNLNDHIQILNNCLNAGTASATAGGHFGMRLTNSGIMDVFHNTIHRRGGGSVGNSDAALYIQGGGLIDVRSNSVSSYNGFALGLTSAFALTQADYNHYYSPGGAPFQFTGTSESSLSAWQSASNFDLNSRWGELSFMNELKCQSCDSLLNSGGAPNTGILYDIDSNRRYPNGYAAGVDIGATEFIDPNSFDLGPDDTVCVATAMCLPPGGEYASISWQINGAVYAQDSVLLGDSSICGPNTYNVILSVSSPLCGAAIDSRLITLVPPPDFQLPDSIHLCANEAVMIGACPSATNIWSTGATSDSILIDSAGIYSLTRMELSCAQQDEVHVTQSDAPDLANVEACLWDAPITINGTIQDGVSYFWDGGSSPTTAANSFNQSGQYTLTTLDAFGCGTQSTVDVLLLDEPVAAIICFQVGSVTYLDASASLYTSENSSIIWLHNGVQFGTGLSDSIDSPWDGVSPWSISLVIDNGCGVDTATKVQEIPGIADGKNPFGISVFPIPAQDVLTVTSAESAPYAQFTILNVQGESVQSDVLRGQSQWSIPVNRLPPGAYFIRLTSDSEGDTFQFMKQ